MNPFPVVDLSGGDVGFVAEQIRRALSGPGVAHLVGHGISDEVIADAYAASKRLFELPTEVKREHLVESKSINIGYNPRGAFKTTEDVEPDSSEAWAMVADFGADHWPDIVPHNSWPDETWLRPPVERYHHEVMQLAVRVLELTAVALELPSDYFHAFHEHPLSVVRLLHYPQRRADATDQTVGVGPHTDWGAITLLSQDDVGTLEVEVDGAWVEVEPVEGSFLLNTGDLFQQWTNDRFRAAEHRVLGHLEHERYSIAVFYELDVDARIGCLPTCFDDDDPPRYPPTTPAAHIEQRYADHRNDAGFDEG